MKHHHVRLHLKPETVEKILRRIEQTHPEIHAEMISQFNRQMRLRSNGSFVENVIERLPKESDYNLGILLETAFTESLDPGSVQAKIVAEVVKRLYSHGGKHASAKA